MRGSKTRAPAGELEQLCLDQLKRVNGFSDVSGVTVAHLIGSRNGNWTVRRITRAGRSKRPVGESWTYIGLPVVDDLRRDWDLAC